jgi:putative protease
VKLTKGILSLGDTIFIKGHTSDFKEKVESMQLDHTPIEKGEQGMEIGLKVKAKVREHDIVYKLLS